MAASSGALKNARSRTHPRRAFRTIDLDAMGRAAASDPSVYPYINNALMAGGEAL
jgi:hypothetical protein